MQRTVGFEYCVLLHFVSRGRDMWSQTGLDGERKREEGRRERERE
jgi:hypothetical protein